MERRRTRAGEGLYLPSWGIHDDSPDALGHPARWPFAAVPTDRPRGGDGPFQPFPPHACCRFKRRPCASIATPGGMTRARFRNRASPWVRSGPRSPSRIAITAAAGAPDQRRGDGSAHRSPTMGPGQHHRVPMEPAAKRGYFACPNGRRPSAERASSPGRLQGRRTRGIHERAARASRARHDGERPVRLCARPRHALLPPAVGPDHPPARDGSYDERPVLSGTSRVRLKPVEVARRRDPARCSKAADPVRPRLIVEAPAAKTSAAPLPRLRHGASVGDDAQPPVPIHRGGTSGRD